MTRFDVEPGSVDCRDDVLTGNVDSIAVVPAPPALALLLTAVFANPGFLRRKPAFWLNLQKVCELHKLRPRPDQR